MQVAIVGSGAVGGYFGAKLARAGHDVTFVARGRHLAAIRERGLTVRSTTGDFAEFTVQARAVDRAEEVPTPDMAIDLGEVLLPRAVRRLHRRSSVANRRAVVRPSDAADDGGRLRGG